MEFAARNSPVRIKAGSGAKDFLKEDNPIFCNFFPRKKLTDCRSEFQTSGIYKASRDAQKNKEN